MIKQPPIDNECDMCGVKLSKRQWEIYYEILEDNTPCYCDIVKRIDKLEKQIAVANHKKNDTNK